MEHKKRHLKDTDFEGITPEDKLYLFWQRYKNPTLVAAWVLFAAIAGYQGTRWIRAFRTERMQKAFSDLENKEERLAFVKKFKNHVLAGLTALGLADESYEKSDYASALNFYEDALVSLKNELLAGRAELGAGMSLLKMGQKEEALRRLSILSANTKIKSSLRAEACYIQAMDALEQGEAVTAYLEQLKTLEDSAPWVSRLELFAQKA